ncbi:glutathione S-transferase family protein [Glaciecola sp. XM2]|uniref:glutathione S-transferase family protein n=1 Tax=Glaciecola sp. XM2 TaxID=1914931 RepID=UPI001BDE9303|nr:glutathione S-transferase family protein [Glaciecola sp. XM2]MBT1451522.1 glutathione S-transferase family protein [Glaciecola sp. XM2]
MKIYGDALSGNCYKVKLTAELLGLSYEWSDIDILQGQTKSESFQQKSFAGKIPLLELADGRVLGESNAIINYLAHGSSLLSEDPFVLAKIQQWQFFEQYSHEPYIAVARFIQLYQGLPKSRLDEYKEKQKQGYQALNVIEKQLAFTDFLVNNSLTTADISLYAYTHVAPEGGILLDNYPKIRAWIERVEALPGYVKIGYL